MPVKPLSRIPGLNTQPEAVLNHRPRGQKITANLTPKTPKTVTSQAGSIVPHSAHAAARSHDYHMHIVAQHTGGRQSSARITDQLNPDRSVAETAATQGRSFPGLANG